MPKQFLERKERNRLIDIIANWSDGFYDVDSRNTFFRDVELAELVSKVNLEGSAESVAKRLVDKLESFGTLPGENNNRHSLGALLKGMLDQQGDSSYVLNQEDGEFIRDLISRYSLLNQETLSSRPFKELRKEISQYWGDILKNSLTYNNGNKNQKLPELGIKLEEVPEAVRSKYGTNALMQSLLNTKSIEEIIREFLDRETRQRLLILGSPASGKTTILLKLLVAIINNSQKQVPVYLNLSSWKKKHENFLDWLVKAMKDDYKQVDEYFIKNLIADNRLVLLLDGLDEIDVEYRENCIQQLNKFIQKPIPDKKESIFIDIVVSTRLQEYEEILGCRLKLSPQSQENQEYLELNPLQKCEDVTRNNISKYEGFVLNLQKAYYVQELTLVQIELYLKEVGRESNALISIFALKESRQIRNPFMLYVLASIKKIEDSQLTFFSGRNSGDQFSNYLFKEYVETRFKLKSYQIKKYSTSFKEKAKYWLFHLATKGIPPQGTTFKIEKMQPNWLNSETDQFIYNIVTHLIVSLILGLIAGFYFIYMAQTGAFQGIRKLDIILTIALKFKLISIGVLSGLISGTVTALLNRLLPPRYKDTLYRFFSRFLHLLLSWYPFGSNTISSSTTTRQFLLGTTFGVCFVLFLFIAFYLLDEKLLMIYISPIYLAGIFGGFIFGLIRKEIKSIETEIVPDWSQVVQFSLILAFFSIPYIMLRFLLNVYSPNRYYYAIYEIIIFMIVGAIYGGIVIKSEDKNTSIKPNQGIKKSGKYSLYSFMSLVFSGTLVGIFMDSVKNTSSIYIGLTVGLLAALGANQGSGIVYIQHYALRLILCCKGYIPWDYAKFLNYAVDLVFVRKYGGTYLFIHDKLKDYFALTQQQTDTALTDNSNS